MFGNIGGKIKVFVTAVTILNIFACIAYGIILILYAVLGTKMLDALSFIGLDKAVTDMTGGATGVFAIIAGILVIIVGSFVSWLIAFIPYGLGQLIQNTDRMVKNMDSVKSTLVKIQNNQTDAANYGASGSNVYTDEYGRHYYRIPEYVYYPGNGEPETPATDNISEEQDKQTAKPAAEKAPEPEEKPESPVKKKSRKSK